MPFKPNIYHHCNFHLAQSESETQHQPFVAFKKLLSFVLQPNPTLSIPLLAKSTIYNVGFKLQLNVIKLCNIKKHFIVAQASCLYHHVKIHKGGNFSLNLMTLSCKLEPAMSEFRGKCWATIKLLPNLAAVITAPHPHPPRYM